MPPVGISRIEPDSRLLGAAFEPQTGCYPAVQICCSARLLAASWLSLQHLGTLSNLHILGEHYMLPFNWNIACNKYCTLEMHSSVCIAIKCLQWWKLP